MGTWMWLAILASCVPISVGKMGRKHVSISVCFYRWRIEYQQCFRFFFSTNFGSFPTAFRRCYSQSPYRQELSGKRSVTDETPVYFQYVGNTQRIVNFHQPDFTIACFVYGFICNHWGFFHSRARLHLSLARCLDQLLLEKLFVGSNN